jgi:hypothetical protein
MQEQEQQQRPPQDLPALDELVSQARASLVYWTDIRDHAQGKVDEAARYVERLTGRAPATGRRRTRIGQPTTVAESAYRAMLTALGNHAYAGMETIAGETSFSTSHVGSAMKQAEQRGHVAVEVRRRGRKRFRLTEAGQEFVTGGGEQA